MSKPHDSDETSSQTLKKKQEEEDQNKLTKSPKEEGDEDCKTPILSEDQKIPAVKTCPPAPAPNRWMRTTGQGVLGRNKRKRSRSRLPFFEDDGKAEVESFFQSTTTNTTTTAITASSSTGNISATGSNSSSISVVPQSTTSSTSSSSKKKKPRKSIK